MNAGQPSPAPPRPARLNPFSFPSNTDFFFALLVVAVLSVSTQLYSLVYFSSPANQREYLNITRACLQQSDGAFDDFQPFNLSNPGNAALAENAAQLNTCMAAIDQKRTAWISAGLLGQLLLMGAIYWFYPMWIVHRGKLSPITREDMPELLDALEALTREAGLKRPPRFYLDALNPTTGGMAFGRAGSYAVKLSGGLATQYYTDPPVFRAVVLHELAHLRNADVDKTFLTTSIWLAFLAAGLLPYMVAILQSELVFILDTLWRAVLMSLLIYGIRNAVLRTREYYADLRAAQSRGVEASLKGIMAGMKPPARRGLARYLPNHPLPGQRITILENTAGLFASTYWVVLLTGVISGMGYQSLGRFLQGVWDASTGWMVAGLISAPLVVSVAGLGIYRTVFARQYHPELPLPTGRLALGLALGTLLGMMLSFERQFESLNESFSLVDALAKVVFDLLWTGLLAAVMWVFFRWLADTAAAWLAVVLQRPSPRPFYLAGAAAAALVLAAFYGDFFSYVTMRGDIEVMALTVLLAMLEFLVSIPTSPVVLLVLISLWALPLSAGLISARRAALSQTESAPAVDAGAKNHWAFLDAPLALIPRTGQPQSFKPTLRRAAAAAAVCVGLYGLLWLLLRVAVPQTVRDQDGFRLAIFVGMVVFSIPFQALTAARVASRPLYLSEQRPDTHHLSAYQGMFAAFLCGVLITAGMLVLVALFGGSIDLAFIWQTAQAILILGGIFSIPLALIAARRHAARQARLVPQPGLPG